MIYYIVIYCILYYTIAVCTREARRQGGKEARRRGGTRIAAIPVSVNRQSFWASLCPAHSSRSPLQRLIWCFSS